MSEGKVVLIARGDQDASWANAESLEDRGFEVVIVDSGFEALKIISDDGTDLLITGSRLTDMTGSQLAGFLRSSQDTRRMPILLIDSGDQDEILGSLNLETVKIARSELEDDAQALEKHINKVLSEANDDTWSKDESPAWRGLQPTQNGRKVTLESLHSQAFDVLILERLVSRLTRELAEITDPPSQFLESFFNETAAILPLDVIGLAITTSSSAWLAYRLKGGKGDSEPISAESYRKMLKETVESLRIGTEPSIERSGEIANEGGREIKKLDIVPLLREGGTRTALIFGSCSKEPYSRANRVIIDQLKTQMQPLIRLLLAKQEINVLQSRETYRASNDPLTGLYNLEFLVGFLQQQLLFSYRQRLPVGLAIIDVDELAKINEDHGFESGDLILTTIANRLMNKTRSSDLIARYGGDEFAVVLPNTDVEGAKILGEKIRSDIEQLSFNNAAGKTIPGVTVTVGCAHFNMEDMNPETILRDAKIALQKSKNDGMNKVYI